MIGNALSVKKDIKESLTKLIEERKPRLVILFGSLAHGKTHKRSDIDLGFLFDGPIDIVDLTNEVTQLLKTDKVDVVDLRRGSPLLRFAAAQGGEVLYEREPGEFIQFYSLSYRMYVDTKKLREAQDLVIERFLQSRGRE
jgi:uncharacterized protein